MLGKLQLYWETPFWNKSPYVWLIYDLVLYIADHFLYSTNLGGSWQQADDLLIAPVLLIAQIVMS